MPGRSNLTRSRSCRPSRSGTTSPSGVSRLSAGGSSASPPLVLLVAVFATPVDTLALHFLLTAHFLQNVTVAEWAPALFVLGLPPSLARRVHVPMLPALAAWLGTYFIWHIPAVYDFALRNQHTVL